MRVPGHTWGHMVYIGSYSLSFPYYIAGKGRYAMLFRKKIDRYCTYCQFAGKIDGESMVCQFCGVVPSDHHCRRFRYDPLRRIPGRPAVKNADNGDADYSL